MIYLASPYSGTKGQIELRYEKVMHIAAALLQSGHVVYSPILHCHEVAQRYDLPTDAGFWRHHNLGMLRYATSLYIALIPGWVASLGIQEERNFARLLNLPEYLVDENGVVQDAQI